MSAPARTTFSRKFVQLVDASDRPVGVAEKHEAHVQGVLHRAFSVFVFRRKGNLVEVLLQKRARGKYHSGGLWTNTCCSHAEPEVAVEITAQIRLEEEMGFSCPLTLAGAFQYRAEVGNGMIEHEIDHVFAAFHDPAAIRLNEEEAEAFRWIDVERVNELLKTQADEFTAWFPKAFEMAKRFIRP